MDLVYAAADIIISRAGASVSELSIVENQWFYSVAKCSGRSPDKNAKAIVEKDGAILLKESESIPCLARFWVLIKWWKSKK
jgi:UDP-N-acetylglucosamine--N-acetylmuramyl-(pentapeptide) pyrophosphoryl-undecaprenol N-acetylglucosamine transferase